jgi:hypothetical protein
MELKLFTYEKIFKNWVSCYGSIEHAHSADSGIEGNPHCQQEQLAGHISSAFQSFQSTTMTLNLFSETVFAI